MLKYTVAAFVLALVVATTLFFTVDSRATGDLIGQWTFDDGTASDTSGNGNDGVVNGAVPASGQFGTTAFDFDGSNDFIDLGNIDGTGSAITVAAWINADTFSNCSSRDCRIVSKATGTATQDHYIMLSTVSSGGGVKLRFRLKAGGSTQTLIADSANLSTGVWTHVAGTYDGSVMRVYVDGVDVGATAKTGAIDTNPSVPFWIGGNPNSPTSRPWNGRIDDVRLYDGALSPAELQLLLSPEPTPGPTDTPVPTATPVPPTPTPTPPSILTLDFLDAVGTPIDDIELANIGASADVQLAINGLDSSSVNVAQISIFHDPAQIEITHSCEGLFAGSTTVIDGRDETDGFSWFVCGLSGSVTGSSGQIMSLTLTRLQAGEPTLAFNTTGGLPTMLFEPTMSHSFDQLDTLTVTGDVLEPTPTPAPTSTPVPVTLTPRTAHTATLLVDGTVLFAGGIGAGGVTLATAEIFDPVSGVVTIVGSLSTARSGHSATLQADGTVLIFGGAGAGGGAPVNSVETFDPVTGTFS